MEVYFICDGNKYTIEDDKIYRKYNNRRIKPTKNGLLKVKECIENIDTNIFSSPRLNEIAKKNKELYKIDILPEVLERMEKFITEEYIDLFYKNLETVRFEFEDPIKCDETNSSNETGYHDAITNVIHINSNSFDYLRLFAKENKLDFELVWKIALAHEIFHLASCNNLFDETGYIYQGLSEVNCNKRYQSSTDTIRYGISTSFTEGITQVFASYLYKDELGVNNYNKFNNTYVDQARIINQLAPMVGYKEIKKAYFKNLGMGYINDKLLRIINIRMLYNELSTNMGRLINNNLNNRIKCTSIVKIQNILLQYEIKYIEMMNKESIDDFVNNINYYFVGLWKDIDNMKLTDDTKALIDENISLFNYIQERQKTYHK